MDWDALGSPARQWIVASACATFIACGHRGTAPHDMGVAEHEAAADRELLTAHKHATQYDPRVESATRCDPGAETICWTPENPTAPHAYEARRREEIAARHRAASNALREAEARACAGLRDADRATSPFEHPQDIRRVTIVTGSRPIGPAAATYPAGIEVEFAAVPGLSATRLQRHIGCHSARNAIIGFTTTASSHPTCPLAVGPVDATVEEMPDHGLIVTIVPLRSADVQSVTRRARALQAPRRVSGEQHHNVPAR